MGKYGTSCPLHSAMELQYFCLPCDQAICNECVAGDHLGHPYEDVIKMANMKLDDINLLYEAVMAKRKTFDDRSQHVDKAMQALSSDLEVAKETVENNAKKIHAIVDEELMLALRELETSYTDRKKEISRVARGTFHLIDRIDQTLEFCRRYFAQNPPIDVLVFKQLIDTRLRLFLIFNPDLLNVLDEPIHAEIPQLDSQSIRHFIRENFALRRKPDAQLHQNIYMGASMGGSIGWPVNGSVPPTPIGHFPSNYRGPMVMPYHGYPNGAAQQGFTFPPLHSRSKQFKAVNQDSLEAAASPPIYESDSQEQLISSSFLVPYTDTGLSMQWPTPLESSLATIEGDDTVYVDKDCSAPYIRPRSGMKRGKMIYHCKFGEFGVMEGQFAEPSGVAVNAQNDIIVADTNNHRIQVFDEEGRFKFQFGECGKRDGQLLYPNRVAVNKRTGDFVVTERSPIHQIQVYNQYGQFLRKFGANILQYPRGVCVDSGDRIIVVECKVMRVLIFDMSGQVLGKFSCSNHLEFPNGVCTNDKEILISDNRAHCIKVFGYDGAFLRTIGGEGVTNYPIGVGITPNGEIVVADNHNNFNLTVFSPEGILIGALESKVKHAQCFDVALRDDNSVALASKDYRLYLYRFSIGQGTGLSSFDTTQ
ncbi:unnamed protein product, partial [Mesorhabditis spiculigera]